MGRTRVRDIMQRKIVTVSAGDRLSTAEDIMTLGGVRHLPVVQRGELVGVLDERDLLRISLSNLNRAGQPERRAFLHAVEIARAMTEPPTVIDSEAPVEIAAAVMAENDLGCLPVVEKDGELVGLITETDLLLHLSRGTAGHA